MIGLLTVVFMLAAVIVNRLPARYFKSDPHSQPVAVFILSALSVVLCIIGLVSTFAR